MSAKSGVWARLKSAMVTLAIGLLLVFFALVAIRLITGRSLGLWNFASSRIKFVSNMSQAVLDSGSVSISSQGDFTNILFLHHSVGRNLIDQGRVGERFAEASYDFWHHDYNWPGLHRPDGSETGYSYNIPNDNTDPDGLARIFSQRAYGLPLNAFSGLLQHEVIAFKSCYPVSLITSEEQLQEYRSYYLAMRDVMDQHPDRIFIVLTPPPLNPSRTDLEAAARARAFASWLKSDEYLAGHPNVFTFDFFGYLAEDDPSALEYNMLRKDYREGSDPHPNQVANETIGPIFVDYVIEAIESYRIVYDTTSPDSIGYNR